MISETLQGVIIGGIFGFLGALTGIFANVWLDSRRAHRDRLHDIRMRLVGEHIQTSEVMEYIHSARRRLFPRFWVRQGADLSYANLQQIDLRFQDLHHVKLFRANLTAADLDVANLSGSDISKAQMNRVDLGNANLSGAKLNRTDLSQADLVHANLTGARLSNATLTHADLSQADLTGADLTNADLTGAKLVDTKITVEQLRRAKSLESITISPELRKSLELPEAPKT
jgi:uncharacterized protein YjbI with pentapeptide repeats